ncbi:MAG: DUF7009 family protein [Pyrinomonadaceae bacterium]
MKLRLRENSIRLRLLQSEIFNLRESGTISEKIRFDAFQTLTYTIAVSRQTEKISARFSDKEIIVEIPFAAAQNWLATNLVGLESKQAIDENSTLKITIEKDFACPERPLDADNADAFPNPKTLC